MRFGAFDIWGVSGAVKFLSISVTLGFCAHYICGLLGPLRGCLDANCAPCSSELEGSMICTLTLLWGPVPVSFSSLRARSLEPEVPVVPVTASPEP